MPTGSAVTTPAEWRSEHGALAVSLSFRSFRDSIGQMRYCYIDANGNESPTLRVHPGDLVTLKLKNEAAPAAIVAAQSEHSHSVSIANPCDSSAMTADATNLHFHGLSIPPACHQDESLNTTIAPASAAFAYSFRIPRGQPPGLYWYHPHIHGNSEAQVLGGASGALIVEGIEQSKSMLANLPERVLVIRDQRQANVPSEANRPAKDLSVNFVPVPYPDFPMAVIQTRPSRRELWRVLNACADTYLDLGVLVDGKWRTLGLVAVDGVPLGGKAQKEPVRWKQDIAIPPGGRAEFIMETPDVGVKAQLLTLGVDTSPPGDEDQIAMTAPANGILPGDDDANPPRQLARIASSPNAPELKTLPASHRSRREDDRASELAAVKPLRQRLLYFSEDIQDPKHPSTSTIFYLTEAGHTPKVFDLASAPDITVHSGDVEDWVIENRSQESHDFHIHQLHFLVLEKDGAASDESYLRDTVDVPYWDGMTPHYPSVKLRMDFRNPEIVGKFPYHCHILQHADGGMMGTVEVLPESGGKARIPEKH
jgi:FtsP/CotA-like multicopper oxidase with cupredoxin domain